MFGMRGHLEAPGLGTQPSQARVRNGVLFRAGLDDEKVGAGAKAQMFQALELVEVLASGGCVLLGDFRFWTRHDAGGLLRQRAVASRSIACRGMSSGTGGLRDGSNSARSRAPWPLARERMQRSYA